MFEEDFGGANRNQVSTISAPIDTPVAQMTPVLKSEAPAEPEAPQAEIRSTDGFKAPDFNNYSDEDKARVKTQYGASWDKMSWWDRQRALAHDSWFQALDTGAIDEETLVDGIFKDPEIDRINKSEVEFKSILRDAVTRDVSAMSDDEAQGYYMALVEADPHFRYKDDADGKMLFGEEAQYGRGNLSRLLGIYKGTNPQGLFSREAQKWFSLSEEQKKQVANDERTIKESVLGMFDDEGNIVASHEEKLMRQEKAVQFATLMGSMSPLGQEIVMKSIESGEIDAKTLNLLDDDERESALAAFRVNKAELDANWWLTQGAARAWETGESMIKGTWRQLANVYWTTGGRLPSGSKQLAAYEDNQLRQLQIEDAMRFKYKDNLTFAGDIAAGLMGSAPYMIAMANPYSGTLAVLGMSNDARERMILSGVDPDTALAVSIPVGVIEGWVEKIQWNKGFGKELTEYALRRTSLLAIAKQLAKGKSKYIGGKLLKAGKETAIVTLTEDCEEILQQITEDLGVQLGETITLGRNEFNVREILEDAWDTAVESFPTTLGFGLMRASGVGPSIHRRFSKNAVIGEEFQEYMQGKNAALNVIGQVNSENPAADIAQNAANPAPTASAEEAGNEPSGAEKAQDGAKTEVYERLLDEMRVKWNRAKSAKARLEMLNDAGLNADQAAVVDEFFRLENDFVGENPVYDFYDPKTQTAYRNFDIMSLPSLMKGVKNVALNEDGTYTLDLQLDADTIVPVKVERVSRGKLREISGSQLEKEVASRYEERHGKGSWAKLDADLRLLEVQRSVPGGFTSIKIGDTSLPYKAIVSLAAPDAATGDPGARNYEVGHEIFHAATLVAKQMGIITDADIAKMREVFGEAVIDGYDYDEEKAADQYGSWLVNQAKDPTGMFGKIRDLFRKIYNALFNKNGNEKATNAEEIFKKVERGDLSGLAEIDILSPDGKEKDSTLRNAAQGRKGRGVSASADRVGSLRALLANTLSLRGDTAHGTTIEKGGQVSPDSVADIFKAVNKDAETGILFDEVERVANALKVEYFIDNAEGVKNKDELAYQLGGSVHYHINRLAGASDQYIADTILHEMIHAVTAYAIDIAKGDKQLPDAKVGKELQDAVAELEQIYRENRMWIQGEYGANNLREFIAELSNSGLRRKLANKSNFRVVVEKIINAIRAMFGLGEKYTQNELTRALNNLDKFLANYESDPFVQYQELGWDLDEADAKEIVRGSVTLPEKDGIYDPRGCILPVRGGWTEKKIKERIKHGSLRGEANAIKLIAEFDSVEELKAHMFYHGSGNAIGGERLTPSITKSKAWVERNGGGGYGQGYWGISISRSKSIASRFGNQMARGTTIYPIILAKGATIVDRPQYGDAAEIEDELVSLWEQGVDAVRLGDWSNEYSEQEMLVLNPYAICNIGNGEYYNWFHLGQEDNPLRIKSDADIAKMLDYAKGYQGLPHHPVKPTHFHFVTGADGKTEYVKRTDEEYAKVTAAYEDEVKRFSGSAEEKQYYDAVSTRREMTRFSVGLGEENAEYRAVEAQYRDTDKWMKAPNGKPTNLTERQWVQVRTPAFKAWFGDWENDPANASKVVDGNGEPRVMFHGSDDIRTEFKMQPGMGGVGAYFTSAFPEAADYVREKLGDPELYEEECDGYITECFLNVRDDESVYDSKYGFGEIIVKASEPTQIKSATDNTGAFDGTNADIRYSVRLEEPPKNTGIGYKVFVQKDGKLYPPMVANPNGEGTPIGVWLNADEGRRAPDSKTGRQKVKAGGKGTNGGGGTLAWRPGWHLGEIPYALQFNVGEKVPNPLGITNKKGEIIEVGRFFPANFVWAEVEYANDVDYQDEAMSYGNTPNGKFNHALAGLPRLPVNGSYKYRTNANPATDPWIITGAMRVKKVLTADEVDAIVTAAGREVQEREDRESNNFAGSKSSAPSGKNKQAGVAYPEAADEIRRYSIGKKAREDAIALILKKRWDIGSSYLSDEENDKLLKQFSEENPKGTFDDFRVWIKGKVAESIVDKIGEFKTPKEQKAALHWFIKGAIRLPEDAPKVTEAVQYGERAKGKANTDPMSYDSPMAMIDALHEFKPKAKPIDPDKCAEFTDRREMGNGVVTYLVQDDRAGQQKMREIINTHWGEDANPWCLLHGDGFGHLSDGTSGGYDAWYYWNHYSALPKRVAFKDGKLLAFMATDAKDDGIRQYEDYAEDIRAQGLPVPSISQWIQEGKYEGKINEQWWDRKDAPHDGIPLGNMPVPGDKFGRWADFEIRDGELKQIAGYRKGNRGESGYVEWYANGLKESQIVKADEEYYDWENNGDLYRAKVNGVQFNFQDGVLQSVYTKVDGEDIYINVDENLAPFDIEVGDEGNYSVGLDDDGNIAAYGESLELEKKLQSAYDKLKPHIAEAERIYRENSQNVGRASVQVPGSDELLANESYIRFSVSYAPSTAEEVKAEAEKIADITGEPLDKCINFVNSQTAISSVILKNREYLDYKADPNYSWMKTNSDYPQGTIDFDNLCIKRKLLTAAFTYLQGKHKNRIITAEDIEELRQTFIELGLPVPCAPCFVEDRRQLLGEIADQFISLYNGAKKIKRISDGKMVEPNKNQKKALNGLNRKGPAPTQYDLITKEGGNALRQSRPDLWNAFLAYNNARGQQSGRLHEGVAEYARQIQEWTKAQINSKNKVGGLRMFSFSDFEAAHLIDLVQIVQDAMVKGLMIQAYTKQPEFAKAARLTRIKINRSLIPLGDGLDKNGELVFDPIEGIDINDKNFVDETDNPDVGNTIIGINYKHIRACMKDVRINQIIPFHTGLKEMILKAKRIAHWENFKNYQHDKVFDAKSIVVNKDGTLSANMELVNAPEMVNIYTDVIDAAADEGKPITNPKQFQEKLFAVCKERGLIPRFWQFIDTKVDKKTGEIEFLYTPGYEKFFVDYKLFDEKGKLIPQQPVVAEWDDEFNKELLNEFVKKAKFDKAHPALSQEVMDYIEERVINGNKDAKKPKVVKRPSGRNLVYATPTPDIGRSSVSRSTKDPADIIAGIVAMKTRRGEKVYINQVQKMLASVGADPALGADIIRRGQQSGEKVGNILKGKAVDDNTFIELATDESKRSRMLQFAERIGTEGYRLGAEDEKKFNALNAAKNEAALVMVENAVGFKASDMEQKYGFDLVSSVQNAKRTGARPIVGKEPDAQNKPGEINGEGIGLDEMMEAEAAAAEARKPEVVEAPESKEMAALKAKAAKRADAIDAQYGLSSGMSPAQLAAAKDAELQAEWNAAHPEDAQGGGEGVEEQPAKKVEVKRDRLDFNRASDFLAFVEEVVAKETGSDTFDSPIQVRNLANTARYFLKKIASRLMYSRDRELIMKDLDGFANIATLRGLESAVMNTYTRIQDKLIPETQEQLIHKLEWAGKQLAEQGIFFSRGGDERDRKVKAKVEEWWRMVKAYLRFSPEAVQEELNRLNGIIEKRTEVAEADKAANPDSPEFLGQDLEYRRAIDLKNALTQYGGLINKTPGEIADKSEEILNQLKGSRFDLENKREDQYILTRTMSEVLKRAVVNPKAQRDRKAPNPNWLVRMFDSMMGVLEVRLRDLIRFSSGETRRKAEVAIQDIEDAIALASQTYNCYLVDNQRQIDEILTKIYGSAEKGIIRLTEDLDEEDRKRIVKQSTTDVISRSWLLQRYVELQQTDDYAQNIAVNKRDGKWREEFDKVFKKYITTDDMTFLVWMRNWYRTNLVDLNEKVLIPVSGIAQYSPGENYFPVKMKLPTREGPVTIAKAWSPLPSWLTPRVYNNYDFDEKTDLVTMWYSRMRESGSSIAYAKLGLNINDVLLNPGFKDAVEANHGEVALRRLSEHLSDIISGGASTIAESDDSIAFADRLRAWQTNLTLSCNYVSALKQMTSSPVYALRHDIDFGMVWRFMTHIDIGSVKELMASDGWKSRYGQGFSEAMQNAMRLNSSVSKGKMASAQNFLHHLYNSGFAVMEFGDSVPCVWVGQGLYRYFLAKIRDEEGGTAVMSEQDIKQRALTRTWAVIEMTQQSKRTENLTAAQRGGPLGRFLYQFVSSPVQQLAYEVQAVREALAARGTDYAAAANAHLGRVLVVNHILMPNFLYLAALVAGLPLGKVPEKDDTFWDFLMNTLMGQYGCIFLAGMVGENTLNALITGKFDYRAQGLPVMGIVDLFQKVGIGMHDLLTWNNDQFADDAIKILKSIGAPTRHAATAIENWGTAKGEKKRKKAVRSWTK